MCRMSILLFENEICEILQRLRSPIRPQRAGTTSAASDTSEMFQICNSVPLFVSEVTNIQHIKSILSKDSSVRSLLTLSLSLPLHFLYKHIIFYIQVHQRYLSYYRDYICPIIAYNGTSIVSSFAPIVVEGYSWRIISLYSSQRIQPYNPTTIGVQLL